MRKLLITILVILFTGVFEQKAAILAPENRTKTQIIINRLDSLGFRTHRLKKASKQIMRDYEN